MNADAFFEFDGPRFSASAPGRLDVMGGIADYSGSLVLEMPIAAKTIATVAARSDQRLRCYSPMDSPQNEPNEVIVAWSELGNADTPSVYNEFRLWLQSQGLTWPGYVFGCVLVLNVVKNAGIQGLDIFIESTVPTGKGVSSSASLEVATMSALVKAYCIPMGDRELPALCQIVEHCIVGAPCGLMDQLTCYFGEANRLLPILCQPDHVQPSISVPKEIHFVGIDSGLRHSVRDASYTDVRTAAYMGYSIIAHHENVEPTDLQEARATSIRDNIPFGGYLANIPKTVFDQTYTDILPVRMSGQEFIDLYGKTIDPVTDVDPARHYAVRACSRHPVHEHARVTEFIKRIEALNTDVSKFQHKEHLVCLGMLMMEAHQSYNACGLGTQEMDRLVDLVREAGLNHHVFGAKITGGGSGGTVCILCEGDKGIRTAQNISNRFHCARSIHPKLIQGSTSGTFWHCMATTNPQNKSA